MRTDRSGEANKCIFVTIRYETTRKLNLFYNLSNFIPAILFIYDFQGADCLENV
jgi:hypothetical protein